METSGSAAATWFRKAAEQRFAPAQYLGLLYSNGVGVPRDDVRAVLRFQKAAHQGYDKARNVLEERRLR